ncbi:MAG: phage portal protein [Planctomycetia bacterium]|nr:phage portal protein [Planctomycetia bacterium]
MFEWLKGIFAARRAPALTATWQQSARFLRARYDAALTTDANRRHWGFADGLSVNSANSPDVRRILRNRARYEVANNSYAKGIVLTLANDVIGTGPRLQMLTDDAEANRRVESEFGRWAKAVRLAEKLRTMRMARTQDGEAFAILINNPRLPTPVQLDLRLVEADQVTSLNMLVSDWNVVDGIRHDEQGNPVEYFVLKRHPGDVRGGWTLDYDAIPAESMIHLYRADRPGQARGIPEITPALPLFAMLRDYSLATLDTAKAAAYYAGIIYTDSPANGESDSVEPMDAVELDRNMLLTMPGGWKMSQLHAEQPTTVYSDFKKEILNEISRCLNVPYNVAAANSSSYNYASGRMDHQVYFKAIRIDQASIAVNQLDRILSAWLDEAVLIEGLLPQSLRTLDADCPHQWFWDGQDHVDPQKEADAQATRLANNTTTLADEYARRGQDWEVQLRQRASELALMRELGLAPADAAPQGTPPSRATDDSPENSDADLEPVSTDD